jgi:hypothetical protein
LKKITQLVLLRDLGLEVDGEMDMDVEKEVVMGRETDMALILEMVMEEDMALVLEMVMEVVLLKVMASEVDIAFGSGNVN